MALPVEARSSPPENIEYWLSVVESRWKQIPEFKVDPQKFTHLAVICDGNRRSATEKGLHPWEGHRLGIEVIKGIAQAAREWDIHTLTFWTWSTENWKRDKEQIDFVMGLAARFLRDRKYTGVFFEHQVRFTHLGRKDRLPREVGTIIEELEKTTSKFDKYRLNLALDYGGRDEVGRGVARILRDIQSGGLSLEETINQVLANPDFVLDFLDTSGQPLPDLVVRTGIKEGEIPHTSGFLPYQTEYSGWAFLPELFPDLTPESTLKTIQDFIEYKRRFGK